MVKKFKYRAESYLKIVTHQRDLVMLEFKNIEAVYLNLKKKIDEIQEKVKGVRGMGYFSRNKKTAIYEVQDSNLYLRRLSFELESCQKELEKTELNYQESYQKLIEAQKDLKSIEKHKELQMKEYLKKTKKEVQKKVDDLNQSHFGRRNVKSTG